MRTDTLAAPDHRLDLRVVQHLVQLRSPQCRRHRSNMLVEHLLCMSHQLTQRLCIAGSHILDGLFHDLVVPFTQCLMQVLLGFGRGKGVGLVQV